MLKLGSNRAARKIAMAKRRYNTVGINSKVEVAKSAEYTHAFLDVLDEEGRSSEVIDGTIKESQALL